MPIKSAKQFRFMHAVKAGDVRGVLPSVGSEMLSKTSHEDKKDFVTAYRKVIKRSRR